MSMRTQLRSYSTSSVRQIHCTDTLSSVHKVGLIDKHSEEALSSRFEYSRFAVLLASFVQLIAVKDALSLFRHGAYAPDMAQTSSGAPLSARALARALAEPCAVL